jgi:hypothetical protein
MESSGLRNHHLQIISFLFRESIPEFWSSVVAEANHMLFGLDEACPVNFSGEEKERTP